MELSLLPCPFCGKPAEASHTMRATIEETMEAEPYINCSQPKCAGRHVCASVSEWQYRTDRIAELEAQLAAAQERTMAIRIIFDGPPGPDAGQFVEVETDTGESISIGEWIDLKDGYWALRIAKLPAPPEQEDTDDH